MREIARRARDVRLAIPGLCAGAAWVSSRREASSVRELGSCRGKLFVNLAIPLLTMMKAN
jgi:hypothetical protein